MFNLTGKLEENGKAYDDILAELLNARKKDYKFAEGHILSSMCTEPSAIAKAAHLLFLETNLGDPKLFPGTHELEQKTVSMLGDLLNAKEIYGHIVSGGTEANITALRIAKKISGNRELIMPRSAHFSIKKAIDLLDLKPIIINLDEQYRMDIGEVEEHISDKTACIVGVAGTTELGVIDRIDRLSEICLKNGVFLHVDACFGGFVIPFLNRPDVGAFDFSLEGVCSMSIDPHKMGMSTVPAGALLVRKQEWFDAISIETKYLSGTKQATIVGTRCSAAAAAAYATMRHFGRAGYRENVKRCMENSRYLVKRVREIGLDVVTEPTLNIVGISVKNPDYIAKKLCDKKWKVSVASYPKCLRIVVMPHVTKDVIDAFIPDLASVCRGRQR